MVKLVVKTSVCSDLDNGVVVCDTGACPGAITDNNAFTLQSLRDMAGSRLGMLLFDIANCVAKAWTFHVSIRT